MAKRPDGKQAARERIAAERAAQAARERRERTLRVVGVAVVLALVVGGGVWWQVTRNQVGEGDAGPQVASTRTEDGIEVGSGGPVVDVYLDFLCPHCADLDDRLAETIGEMAAGGEATFVLRPVTFLDPEESSRSAAALGCAAGTTSVLGFQKALFENSGGGFSTERLVEIGASVGLDDPDFVQCVEDGDATWANAVDAAARDRGIRGTPTVYVDGELMDLALTDDPATFRESVLAAAG